MLLKEALSVIRGSTKIQIFDDTGFSVYCGNMAKELQEDTNKYTGQYLNQTVCRINANNGFIVISLYTK